MYTLGFSQSISRSETDVLTQTNTSAGGVLLGAPLKLKIGGKAPATYSPYSNLETINVGLTGEHAAMFAREARGFLEEARAAADAILSATPGSESLEGGATSATMAGSGSWLLLGALALVAWGMLR
jgi:hypothetical protein